MAGDARGPLETGQQFSPRYLIVRLLGMGGMGAVYQAWDAELSVTVAVKVIRPEVTGDPDTARSIERRFKQELLLARQVTHRNVVRIHDLGEIDGIKYITMPYIEGEDLASVLKKAGRLPVARVLAMARQIAAGLQAAHDAGVVHRDLKPPNVMIANDDHAIIMDFGIARSAGAAHIANLAAAGPVLPVPPVDAITQVTGTLAGGVVGTIEYMAPEQVRGESVDQRADIYAFGLMLHDMLTGRSRTAHASAITELHKRLVQPPPSVETIVPDVPQPFAQVIARCVEPDAHRRFATTADLVAALDRLDDHGRLRPTRRVVGLPLAAAVVVLLLTVSGAIWWFRPEAAPVAHDPVSVLIADFVNHTGDTAFDRTLEPLLKRGLEGAGFISAFDRNAIRATLGALPPEQLDEGAARALAVQHGIGVVLSGSIGRSGRGYEISVKATQPYTAEVLADAGGRATSKEQVVQAATRLVANVRQALGDETSESSQMFAMASLSATSLDVVREYAAAQNAASNGRFDEALASAQRAVALDPGFGIGYQLLAVASRNLGRVQDAEKYSGEALRYLDGMTERERFSTRGMYYRVTGDYPQCVKEYSALIERYSADVVARNQLALCASKLRDLQTAVKEMRQVVEMLPSRVLFRDNLALYANYAADFQTAEQEVQAIKQPDAYAVLAAAFAQLGQRQFDAAANTYAKLAAMGPLGASMAASGLGDLAMVEGRYSDAARILERGVAADLAAKNGDTAAAKLALLAHVQLLRGQPASATAAAQKALENSNTVGVRFLAARAFIAADDPAAARELVHSLASALQAEPRSYAKILEGEIALHNGNPRQAIALLTEANGLLDTWIGRYVLGRAYLEAGAYAQADSEFDRCIKRRGEALSLFLDEQPTYGLMPPVYYYQGRVRQALKSEGFAQSYLEYRAIRGSSSEDSLLKAIPRGAGL
jgi:eukaryotic-like serine/threonine-protein kinase